MFTCSPSMESHKCKLCSRSFANGRALGGHMKAHLAILPLHQKSTTPRPLETESDSSSYCSSDEDQEQQIKNFGVEVKGFVYGLRENPKKCFRFVDPEFSFCGSVLIQDRESETESRNPTRTRSKRARKSGFLDQNFDVKFKNTSSAAEWPSLPPPQAEQEPVSSVSDTSPEEDLAMCLMMLSRDVWKRNNGEDGDEDEERDHHEQSVHKTTMGGEKTEQIIKTVKFRGKLRCEKCMKLFRSSQAMVSHKKICSLNVAQIRSKEGSVHRIFECPYCFKVFGSGQALGGHKRSHLIGSSPSSMNNKKSEHKHDMIDLNLPAPMDDEELSVVSDA